MSFCGCCDSSKPYNIDNKLARWYTIGQERLEKELDVIKLVKHLRELRLMTKSQRLEDDLKSALATTGRNVIDLDSEELLEREELKLAKEPWHKIG